MRPTVLLAILALAGISFTASISGCQQIDNVTDTTYALANNLVGANISASPFGGNACLKIVSSNIVLDCNGYNITDSVGTTSYGILLNGSLTNVTVKNCPRIFDYSYGLYSYRTKSSAFYNNSARNSGSTGIYLDETNESLFVNNSVNGSTYGFYLSSSHDNSLINNSGVGATFAFYVSSSHNNNFTDNLAIPANSYGFYLTSSHNNSLRNSTFSNAYYGFYLSSSHNNTMLDSAFRTNNGYGITLSGSHNNTMGNVSINNSYYGFYIASSSHNNTVVDCTPKSGQLEKTHPTIEKGCKNEIEAQVHERIQAGSSTGAA
ncbi:MAG: NosD domain-containing protein, partial [Candidatus Micrarchaeota archaeon]